MLTRGASTVSVVGGDITLMIDRPIPMSVPLISNFPTSPILLRMNLRIAANGVTCSIATERDAIPRPSNGILQGVSAASIVQVEPAANIEVGADAHDVATAKHKVSNSS